MTERRPTLSIGRHTTRAARTLAVAAALLGTSAALATSPLPPAPRPPACLDTPAVDPVLSPVDLPMHVAIANYLRDQRNPVTFACDSPNFRYEGTRSGSNIEVVSTHLPGGQRHTVYGLSANLIQPFARHGLAITYWPNGRKLAEEYFCGGYAVGFHRYFDADGALTHVADYTHSDYERERPRELLPQRKLVTAENSIMAGGMGAVGNASYFRVTYAVAGGKAVKVGFATTGGVDRWFPWDPAATIDQWVIPGDQGEVLPLTRAAKPLRIVNNALRYLPLHEAYQRNRLGLEPLAPFGLTMVQLLRCPILDEAMKPPIDDLALKLPVPRPVTEDERQVTPEGKLAACMQQPASRCFLELSWDLLRHTEDDRGLKELARIALALGRPEIALAAAERIVAPRPGYNYPNPVFAEAAALKAQATRALGRDADADRLAAFEHAMLRRPGYEGRNAEAIMKVGPVFAEIDDVERLRVLRNSALTERQPPQDIEQFRVWIALALARRGNHAEALATLAPAQHVNVTPAAPPFGGLPQVEARALGQAALLDGWVARRNDEKIRAQLAIVAPLVASLSANSRSRLAVLTATIRAHAWLGEIEAARALAFAPGPIIPELAAALAIGAGRGGHRDAGIAALEAPEARPRVARHMTSVAVAEAQCQRSDRAGAMFEQALTETQRNQNAMSGFGPLIAVREAMLEAGAVDLLMQEKPYDTLEFRTRVAMLRAREGDVAGALADIDTPLPVPPNWSSPADRALFVFDHGIAVALARAAILGHAKRTDDARAARVEALRRIMAYDRPEQRAQALMRLANAELAFDRAAARDTLILARLTLDQAKRGAPGGTTSSAQVNATWIVQAFVELDDVAEAQATLDGVVVDASQPFGRDAERRRGLGSLQAEIARLLAEQGEHDRALSQADAIGPADQRLVAWSRLRDRAKADQRADALAELRQRLQAARRTGPALLDDSTGSAERAAIVVTLVDAVVDDPPASPGAALDDLMRLTEWLQPSPQQAGALCRIGRVASTLGDATIAEAAFGRASATPRNELEGESVGGFCAAAMRDSGFDELAKPFLEIRVASRPGYFPQPITLHRLALRFGSYERREFIAPR